MYAPSPEKVRVIKQLARPEIVFAAARKPGTGLVFFGGSDFKVHAVDLAKDKPEPKELGGHDSYVTGLALAGPFLVSGGYDGRLIWWDVESGSRVRSVDAHGKWIRRVAATPDGSVVASVADDMVCRLWDVASGRLLHELRGHAEQTPHHFASMLFACAISPDGRRLATGDKVGHINVWEVRLGQQARRAGRADLLHLGPGPEAALDRRHPRWPSRPTANGSRSAGSARSATSTTSTASRGSRSSTGARGSGWARSRARAAAWSSGWNSTPGATGCWAPAATPTASSSSATPPARRSSPRPRSRCTSTTSRSTRPTARSTPSAIRRSLSCGLSA